jgi:hypothetical protein
MNCMKHREAVMRRRALSRLVVTALACAYATACGLGGSQAARAAAEAGTIDAGPRTGFYTDLSSAPQGALVTAYGKGFGSDGEVTLAGEKQRVITHADHRVVFEVGGTGGELRIGGQLVGMLPVHRGRVLEATPRSLRAVWARVAPGDVVYLRGGVYTEPSAEGDWNMLSILETWKKGAAGRPIAVVAWPGEDVVLKPRERPAISLGDGGRNRDHAEHLTFAGFRIVAESMCINGGGDVTADSTVSETGGRYIRVVDIECSITDATSNTMGSAIAIQSDGWRVLGVSFIEPAGRVIFNNNHAVYVANGADDVEIAYSRFVNLRMGHVIQIHQDGVPRVFERIWIHDNHLEGAADTDMRGITVSNVASESTVTIERNLLRRLGQDFSGIAVYGGDVAVRDNLFDMVRAPNILLNGMALGHGPAQSRKVTASGNRFSTVPGYPAVAAAGGTANLGEIDLRGNAYCGSQVPRSERAPVRCEPER